MANPETGGAQKSVAQPQPAAEKKPRTDPDEMKETPGQPSKMTADEKQNPGKACGQGPTEDEGQELAEENLEKAAAEGEQTP